MILYHGSNISIDKIDLSKSKKGKDFGRGFYLSDNEAQAMEMARATVARLDSGDPCVTRFSLKEETLSSQELSIKKFEGYTIEWAEFVLKNRSDLSDVKSHPYDIVIGPIADDRVGLQIRRYKYGDINVEQFVEELKFYKGMTMQYYFGTDRAIETLEKL